MMTTLVSLTQHCFSSFKLILNGIQHYKIALKGHSFLLVYSQPLNSALHLNKNAEGGALKDTIYHSVSTGEIHKCPSHKKTPCRGL